MITSFAKISIPLWTPDLPHGSYQKVLWFQSFSVASLTGIFNSSGIIKPRKNIVTIDGAVKRSAKYELNDEEYLDSIFRFANGMKQTAALENIS